MVLYQDTIYALSSGAVPSGVAVVRVSGSGVTEICESLCGGLPSARQAELKLIRNRNGEEIDSGLVLHFPGPRSFTGEDCVEFQVHGGRAVVDKLLSALSEFEFTRLADAGEFTRRAFNNGKFDLVEVEGLADLVTAETEMQRRLALEQAKGGFAVIFQQWAKRLTFARAMIEAELDFADEGDVPGSVAAQIWDDILALKTEIDSMLRDISLGEIIRDGLNVVIYGAPNAGKSSLMNMLARSDVAIVTEVPGTTRDILKVDVNIGGFLVHLTDTAGIRTTSDVVEIEGIRRARNAVLKADLVLHLVDLSSEQVVPPVLVDGRTSVIRIGTKADVKVRGQIDHDVALEISVMMGWGIDSLMKRMIQDLETRLEFSSGMILSRKRHYQHLESASEALELALGGESHPLEIRAENLRLAGDSLGRITGRVDTETLLGVIFSEFCIGK